MKRLLLIGSVLAAALVVWLAVRGGESGPPASPGEFLPESAAPQSAPLESATAPRRQDAAGDRSPDEEAEVSAPPPIPWSYPPDPYWLQLRSEVDQALQRLGRDAFRARVDGDVEERIARLHETLAPPVSLPAPDWLQYEVYGSTRGVILGEARRVLPGPWADWAQELARRLPQDPSVQTAILWAGMLAADGPIDLARFQAHFREYCFLGGTLGRCREEWVRGLARTILESADERTEREIWTLRSLAALAWCDRYEDDADVRTLLERALGEREPYDLPAHPGALRGLCAYGGEHARAVLRKLLQRESYWGRPMLIAWGGALLGAPGGPSAALLLLRQADARNRAQAAESTQAALDAYQAGGRADEALLDELVNRALDPEDQSVDRAVLMYRLSMEALDPAAGAYLATELSFQDPVYCSHLSLAVLGLLDGGARAEDLAALRSDLAGLEERYASEASASTSIRAARALLDKRRQ